MPKKKRSRTAAANAARRKQGPTKRKDYHYGRPVSAAAKAKARARGKKKAPKFGKNPDGSSFGGGKKSSGGGGGSSSSNKRSPWNTDYKAMSRQLKRGVGRAKRAGKNVTKMSVRELMRGGK